MDRRGSARDPPSNVDGRVALIADPGCGSPTFSASDRFTARGKML